MRFAIALALAVLLLPMAFSSVDITLDQDYFNMGDTVEVSASVDAEQTVNGFLKMTAQCGSFSLPYYLSPIKIQQGYRTQVAVPPLKVGPSLKDKCLIKGELEDENGVVIDSGATKFFTVSSGLGIVLFSDNLSTLPGDTKKIDGVVRGVASQTVNADITFWFEDEEFKTSTFNGKFVLMLTIPPQAKTGARTLKINAQDASGNQGSTTTEVVVQAIPTHLEIAVSPSEQNPGESISYTATLTDQAGELIADSISLSIKDADGSYVFKGESASGQASSYALSQYAKPGEYHVQASYQGLGAESRFAVNIVKDVKLAQNGEGVDVENTGNVPYKEEVSIVVEGEGKSYLVKEKVNLEPGKIAKIDLRKEVPYGRYSILVPQQLAEILAENESSNPNTLLAENVEIHDSRSTIKKATSGVSSITGNIVGSDGIIARNGWMAPLILVGVVILIGLYYTRDIWLLMMMRRK